jgi:hypothetical protein
MDEIFKVVVGAGMVAFVWAAAAAMAVIAWKAWRD